jgi:hypothetical protein
MLSTFEHAGIRIALLAAMILLGVSAASTAEAADEEAEPPNGVGVFFGNTQNGSLNGAILGFEYERKMTSLIGVGAIAEYAGGDFESVAIFAPVYFHPHAGWVFKIAPGLNAEDSKTSFVVRTGIGYEFKVAPKWALAPQLNADFVHGETELVYGLAFTRHF